MLMPLCCVPGGADRPLLPHLGDDDSSSGDDSRGGLWGLVPIDENTAPALAMGSRSGSFGRLPPAAGLARGAPLPGHSMFSRDSRPAWVSAALLVRSGVDAGVGMVWGGNAMRRLPLWGSSSCATCRCVHPPLCLACVCLRPSTPPPTTTPRQHRFVHRVCACVQSNHCGVARSAIDMCDPQAAAHVANFARSYLPSSRPPRSLSSVGGAQTDASFSAVILSSPHLARRVVLALHAAASSHWSRGVRERAYTVASRLIVLCGIPEGPEETGVEEGGPHASPRSQLLANAVASMATGSCGRAQPEPSHKAVGSSIASKAVLGERLAFTTNPMGAARARAQL
jgi:hypothetical protein